MSYRMPLILAMLLMSISMGGGVQAEAAGDTINVAPTDWAWWRGPNRNGVAATDQTPPMQWDDAKNVLWKVPVPGRGHGSPTVVGDQVFLATADETAEVQSVLCFDRATGEQRWKTDIHQGGFKTEGRQGHIRSTKASSTVACDGERVFAAFLNGDAIHLTALSLDGKQLWQHKVSDFVVHQGYGASPAVYGPLVIVSADHKAGGAISAYDRASGEMAWTVKRPAIPNYTSPIILNVAGKDQLVIVGCNLVSSYEPLTGKVIWETAGATEECVTSMVSDGQNVVTSGGYPTKHVAVIKGDGSAEVRWSNKTQVYVPSMLVHEGHLYAVTDSGEAICYEMETGTVKWEHRLGGNFAASPILVGDQIYAARNDGTTYIFKANPAAFEQVGENKLTANEVQATPVICDSKIYMRVAVGEDATRQEMLYCLAG